MAKVLLLSGDGIGPEVLAEAERVIVTLNQACPNVFRAESAGCRLEVIPGPPEYAKALFPTGFSRTG